MTAIRDKLRRLVAKFPVAMVLLGVLLTIAWTGVLIWIVFDLIVMVSQF